jgi:hypothetical protein
MTGGGPLPNAISTLQFLPQAGRDCICARSAPIFRILFKAHSALVPNMAYRRPGKKRGLRLKTLQPRVVALGGFQGEPFLLAPTVRRRRKVAEKRLRKCQC